MKRTILIALAALLLLAAFPALAYAPGDNILLNSGIPYGNYGYMGLIALYDGDMQQVDAHMRSPFSNQQGAGVSTRQRVVAVASASVLPEPTTWQEWLAMYAPGVDEGDVNERPVNAEIPGGAYFLHNGALYHNASDDPIRLY